MYRPQNRTAALLAAFGCALVYLPAGRALAAVCAALPLSAAGQSFALHCAAAPLAEERVFRGAVQGRAAAAGTPGTGQCACRRRCLRCSTAERPESPMRWCCGVLSG